MAYLGPIPKPKCEMCGRPAVLRLHSSRGRRILGDYCASHATKALLRELETPAEQERANG